MTPDINPKQQEQLVIQHVNALMEHFDCVQILVSSSIPDGTSNVFIGGGNWFARQGMAHEFIRKDKAQTDAREISLAIQSTPPDDGEEWKK